jgi:hypothetical protein
MRLTKSLVVAATLVATSALAAELTDAPNPDIAALLQALKGIKEQQLLQVKSSKQKVLQEAQAAAATPSAASAAWVEAIRQTQIEGVEKEGAQLRAWRDGDGAAFSDKEVQYAAQLYFRWLALTMQRSMGATPRELLPQVIQFTKDAAADRAAMEALTERANKERDLARSKLHGARKENGADEDRARKVHDMILRGLGGSAPVKAMHAEELVRVEKWENAPGNVDGIFANIILPELRLVKDPRVLEYWDMKIKQEAEFVKNRPAFDQEKFAKETRPNLLWSRAQEYVALGMRNRAIGEMFQIIRGSPQHPSVTDWIGAIETILTPGAVSTAPAAPASAPAPASTIPAAPVAPTAPPAANAPAARPPTVAR